MNGFSTGLIIGIFITIACYTLARRGKRMVWVRQHTDVLMTRLGRLMYIYNNIGNMETSDALDQLEEATREFAGAIEDLSESMKEIV